MVLAPAELESEGGGLREADEERVGEMEPLAEVVKEGEALVLPLRREDALPLGDWEGCPVLLTLAVEEREERELGVEEGVPLWKPEGEAEFDATGDGEEVELHTREPVSIAERLHVADVVTVGDDCSEGVGAGEMLAVEQPEGDVEGLPEEEGLREEDSVLLTLEEVLAVKEPTLVTDTEAVLDREDRGDALAETLGLFIVDGETLAVGETVRLGQCPLGDGLPETEFDVVLVRDAEALVEVRALGVPETEYVGEGLPLGVREPPRDAEGEPLEECDEEGLGDTDVLPEVEREFMGVAETLGEAEPRVLTDTETVVVPEGVDEGLLRLLALLETEVVGENEPEGLPLLLGVADEEREDEEQPEVVGDRAPEFVPDGVRDGLGEADGLGDVERDRWVDAEEDTLAVTENDLMEEAVVEGHAVLVKDGKVVRDPEGLGVEERVTRLDPEPVTVADTLAEGTEEPE